MGFYLRKSIKVGPVRFNLSKSGVGLTAGIKGARIGIGPRGNYIHLGRGGLYYRASLPSGGQPASRDTQPHSLAPKESVALESSEASSMVDTSAMELLDELNAKQKIPRYAPIVQGLTFTCLFLGLLLHLKFLTMFTILAIGIFMYIYASRKDTIDKTTVMMYELDDELERAYQNLHDRFDDISVCQKIWIIDSYSINQDVKYTAGADRSVARQQIFFFKGQPPYVATNISVPAIPAAKQTLYFFPERILVFDKTGIGVISYADLNIDIGQAVFVENKRVPSDAEVVGKTWQFVNKHGGPDKRFKNNTEYPQCLYENMTFISTSGLLKNFQLSKQGTTEPFKEAIRILIRKS